jgi:rhodanese-related sulfurtransferase
VQTGTDDQPVAADGRCADLAADRCAVRTHAGLTRLRGRIRRMTVPSVPVADLPDDAAMLDVREADEWAAGHAPTAQHLPMSELTGRLAEVLDDDPLYVVCRSGGRSARVVAFLAGQGYPAVNVDGGMQAWAGQGRAVVAEGGGAPEIV